ncbi:MAG: MgtC/SapB family protein [Ilumatobacteraceae bacterium]
MLAIVGPNSWGLVARVALAALLTAFIGLEREFNGHPAGIRTHAIVGLGAALFTVAGAFGFSPQATDSPSRVAAQVVTGIGFLGAGTILRHRDRVRGLTTAATLWFAAGVGVACGAGLLAIAAASTGIALVLLLAGRITDPMFRDRQRTDEYPRPESDTH